MQRGKVGLGPPPASLLSGQTSELEERNAVSLSLGCPFLLSWDSRGAVREVLGCAKLSPA